MCCDHGTLGSTALQFLLLILDLLLYKSVMTDSFGSLAKLKINNIHSFSFSHSPFLHLRCCTDHCVPPGAHFLDRSFYQHSLPMGEESPYLVPDPARGTRQPYSPRCVFCLRRSGSRPLMARGCFFRAGAGDCTVASHCCCPGCDITLGRASGPSLC